MVFVLGIASAAFVGLGLVLQQRVAQRLSLSDFLTVRLLWHLARQRQWLLGLAIMIVGQVLGAFALDRGDVSLVEPLLATNLFFALAFARTLGGHPLGRHGWSGVVTLAAGVVLFIVAGQPHSGTAPTSELRHWLVFGTVVGIAAVLVGVARRLNVLEEAALLGGAAGMLFGLQDALTHVATRQLTAGGLPELLTAWQPYALVAVAAAGQVLMQSAFEAAPLRSSLPAITAAEPLAGIACGVGILGDHLNVTGLALAGEVIGLLCCVIGVVVLGRHPGLPAGACARAERPAPSAPGGRPSRDAGIVPRVGTLTTTVPQPEALTPVGMLRTPAAGHGPVRRTWAARR